MISTEARSAERPITPTNQSCQAEAASVTAQPSSTMVRISRDASAVSRSIVSGVREKTVRHLFGEFGLARIFSSAADPCLNVLFEVAEVSSDLQSRWTLSS